MRASLLLLLIFASGCASPNYFEGWESSPPQPGPWDKPAGFNIYEGATVE